MKSKSLILAGLVIFLASCSRQTKISYNLGIHAPDSSKVMNLVQASEKMMIRRLAAAKVPDYKVSALPTGSGSGRLEIQLPDQEAADLAGKILSEKFTFEIKLDRTKPGSKTASGSAAPSDWVSTGIKNEDLVWIQPISDSTGQVGVELVFTPEGRTKLAKVFKENSGRYIGIFVRDLLVSKLKIQGTKLASRIIISGIPSSKVAEIFADDVNVGLNVSFTPAN